MQAMCTTLLLLLFTHSLAAQPSISATKDFDKAYYQKLSKQQKNGATGLVIGGGALAVVGGFIWAIAPVAGLSETGDVEGAKRTGRTMTFVGTGLAALSIPLFIASDRNKQKAILQAGTGSLRHPLAGRNNVLYAAVRLPF